MSTTQSPLTMLRLVTPPETEAVSLEDAKAQARIEYDEEDEQIKTWIDAATRLALVHTDGRALITADYELDLDRFPCDLEFIELPRSPLQEVTEITYYDSDGGERTLDDETYLVFTPSETSGFISLAPNQSWPSTQCRPNAVTVAFTAGYGDEPEDVPAAIRQGIMLTVATWIQNREQGAVPEAALNLFRSQRAGNF